MVKISQYEVYWVNLDPTIGSEITKTRPCVIVSPNELNKGLGTVLAAPLTSTIRNYPFRSLCTINEKRGSIALDQIRCVDKSRLFKKLAKLNKSEILELKSTLHEMLIK